MAALIGLIMAFVYLIFTTALNGFVLSKLWFWFMVPAFGLPPLHIAYALGMSLIIALLTKQVNFNTNNP